MCTDTHKHAHTHIHIRTGKQALEFIYNAMKESSEGGGGGGGGGGGEEEEEAIDFTGFWAYWLKHAPRTW